MAMFTDAEYNAAIARAALARPWRLPGVMRPMSPKRCFWEPQNGLQRQVMEGK